MKEYHQLWFLCLESVNKLEYHITYERLFDVCRIQTFFNFLGTLYIQGTVEDNLQSCFLKWKVRRYKFNFCFALYLIVCFSLSAAH